LYTLRAERRGTLSLLTEFFGQSEKGTELLLGVHWIFDKTEAIAQGRRVAGYVFANAFLPGAQKESGREIILGASRCYIGGHRMALPYLF